MKPVFNLTLTLQLLSHYSICPSFNVRPPIDHTWYSNQRVPSLATTLKKFSLGSKSVVECRTIVISNHFKLLHLQKLQGFKIRQIYFNGARVDSTNIFMPIDINYIKQITNV